MKDYYLADLAEETGDLFEHWACEHLNMKEMVTQYMKSTFRDYVDKRYAKFCTQTWYEMDQAFAHIDGGDEYDPILCEWLGQFYTYLQERTNKSSRELVDKYPFSLMYIKSQVLHDLDMELAIERVAA